MKKQGTFLGMPYDWRALTKKRLKSRLWNKNEHKLITPRVFGWGYSLNFYELLFRRKKLLFFLILLIICASFIVNRVIYVKKAHMTFENYYAFRGCTQLLKRTQTYALCTTNRGETIKIVKYHNEWYLDGDLPTCFKNFCF